MMYHIVYKIFEGYLRAVTQAVLIVNKIFERYKGVFHQTVSHCLQVI